MSHLIQAELFDAGSTGVSAETRRAEPDLEVVEAKKATPASSRPQTPPPSPAASIEQLARFHEDLLRELGAEPARSLELLNQALQTTRSELAATYSKRLKIALLSHAVFSHESVLPATVTPPEFVANALASEDYRVSPSQVCLLSRVGAVWLDCRAEGHPVPLAPDSLFPFLNRKLKEKPRHWGILCRQVKGLPTEDEARAYVKGILGGGTTGASRPKKITVTLTELEDLIEILRGGKRGASTAALATVETWRRRAEKSADSDEPAP